MSQLIDDIEASSPKIKLIAAGGAACNFVQNNCDLFGKFADVLCMDSDIRSLRNIDIHFTKYCILVDHFKGFGSGGDIDFVQKHAEKEFFKVTNFFEKTDIIIFIVGLGGGTGSGMYEFIAQKAVECGAFLISIPILPFEFEGKNRVSAAEIAIKRLHTISDVVIPVRNDALFQYSKSTDTINEAFALCNSWMASLIGSLTSICMNIATTGCNFNSLVKNFSDKPENVFWGVGYGDNAQEACDSILKFPMLFDIDCKTSIKRAILYIKTDKTSHLETLKNINYSIQKHLNDANTNIVTANEVVEAVNHKVEAFLIYSHARSNNKIVRYKKDKFKQLQRKGIQPQFEFDIIASEDYFDTPTYIRKGIKLDR